MAMKKVPAKHGGRKQSPTGGNRPLATAPAARKPMAPPKQKQMPAQMPPGIGGLGILGGGLGGGAGIGMPAPRPPLARPGVGGGGPKVK